MNIADLKYVTEGIFRWLHVLAGVVWIGHLFFFNFVNSNFAPTMDAETKKKVVPQLMPRALFFFRWGAAWTWITGFVVLLLAYYHGPYLFEGDPKWSIWAFLAVAFAFLAFGLYDVLCKTLLKDSKAQFFGFWILASLCGYAFRGAGFGFRGYAIHIGAMFGTIMAANVWMRIWPAQKRIITAVKNGEKPLDADVAIAGSRSKHNTYMSVPLLFMMISKSAVWAAHPGYLSLIILLGFVIVWRLYEIGKKVPGF